MNPPEPAVSAVMTVAGPGGLNRTCRQLAPPSADSSANGMTPPAPVSWPRATTRFPLIATCWSTAEEAPAGSARTIVVHSRPSVVVQTAGWLSCEPTDTKPCGSAATARTWAEPVVTFMSRARTHEVRLLDHQTSATLALSGPAGRPTTEYPAGPAAAATADTPPRSFSMSPPARRQAEPSAEVRTTGPGTPTASQPDGP